MKARRVLVLMHEDFVPPETITGLSDEQIAPFKTEYDVVVTLKEQGHDVRPLGVSDDLTVIREALHEFKPDIVFNLLEEFGGLGTRVPYVLAYLELLGQPYTGCNPRGLIFADNKALIKKILRHHRIAVPDFALFRKNRTIHRPRRLKFPLIVKSPVEHGSVAIAQRSVVEDDEQLVERVRFVHENTGGDAMAEQFIEGRELYVGVMGNRRLQTFPVWEMTFRNLPEGAPKIATSRVKWDYKYQKEVGVRTHPAKLTPELEKRIIRLCKRAYRFLEHTGYARMDLRLTEDGHCYLIESNPNPQLAYGEDFAESADKAGLTYEQLLERIMNLGKRYAAEFGG